MRVAILGASGQLGTDLVRVFSSKGRYEVHALTHGDVEVTDMDSLRAALEASTPQVVINTTAFHRVDECEDNPEKAFRVNALGALNVARLCRDLGAACVYISTDYVFSGEKDGFYTEDDTPVPVNVYGASKLAGEHLVRQTAPQWIVARVASLFGVAGARGKGGNFVESILKRASAGEPLRVVDDIRMSPTYTVDAARALEWIVGTRRTGIFHLSNQGTCSWYEFASAVLALAGMPAMIERTSAAEYPARARRPPNSALKSVRIGDPQAVLLRPWRQALGEYLRERMQERFGAP